MALILKLMLVLSTQTCLTLYKKKVYIWLKRTSRAADICSLSTPAKRVWDKVWFGTVIKF